jgi:probable HAF family extracellular repeat protein
MNNATAIDNNGDIVGYGTDINSNTYQAFEILNVATPEPGTLTLLAVGLVGLLAYAWRKRK